MSFPLFTLATVMRNVDRGLEYAHDYSDHYNYELPMYTYSLPRKGETLFETTD